MKRCLTILLVASLFLAGYALTQHASNAKSKVPATVTFNKDVAPIVFGNCAVCHRPGEVAPMSLLSYKEVRPWAKSIRETVVKRQMPP